MRKDIDWKRTALFFCFILVSAVCSWFCPANKAADKDVLTIILTVFPVLTGFSFTVIAIAGCLDATMANMNLNSLYLYKSTFEAKLIRLVTLAVLQTAVIVVAIVLRLDLVPQQTRAFDCLARMMFFLGTMAMLVSFLLPAWLRSLYVERYDALLNQKKNAPAH